MPAGQNRANSHAHFVKHAHATSLQGLGWGVLTIMSTCCTRTCYVCYVTPGFGVGVCVNVRVNFPHMLRQGLAMALDKSKVKNLLEINGRSVQKRVAM